MVFPRRPNLNKIERDLYFLPHPPQESMELGIWIVWLVRAPWIAVILLMVIASIPSSKLRLFHELVWSFTGRGKILLPSSSQVFHSRLPHLSMLLESHVLVFKSISFVFCYGCRNGQFLRNTLLTSMSSEWRGQISC